MRKSYTPDELRKLSTQIGPQWSGEARAALCFAADVIAAANSALAQPPTKPLTIDEIRQLSTPQQPASAKPLTLTDDEIRAVYKKLWPGGPSITVDDYEFARAVLATRSDK